MTNDDGIDSEGLHHLARAMTEHGEVTVVAPDREYSGASASLGVLGQMQPEVHRVEIEGVPEAWAVSGPPALCVMFATLGVFDHAFDLVAAGINPGINVGRAVYHSGTVGAAMTARIRGINAVAVSQAVEGFGVEGQGWDEMLRGVSWSGAADVASAVVSGLRSRPSRHPVLLNVNVPNMSVKEMAGWQRTTIGRIPPRVIAEATLEPRIGHQGTYKVVMKWGDAVSLPEGTDGGAVERNLVSLTPLGLLTETITPSDATADDEACAVVGEALDELFSW